MGVAHDVSVESHTVATPSTNEASFSFSVAAAAAIKGILIWAFDLSSATNAVQSIDYGGSNVPAIAGGEAQDSATEPGSTKGFFLGAAVPGGTKTCTVTRTNNANGVYVVVETFTALGDLEVVGIVLLQEDGTWAEQNVDDGTPGTNSLRAAAGYSGDLNTLPAGANSTLLQSIDIGPRSATVVRETTAGQGSRPVGFAFGTSDDRAGVHLAIREIAGGTPGTATPATVAAVASVPTPSAQGSGGASPATVAGAASVPTPSAQGSGAATPATVAGTASVPTPSAQGEGRASPATVAGIASVPTPSAQGAAVASPPTVAGVASVPIPAASGGGAGTAAPSTVAGVAAVPTPSAQGEGRGSPSTVAAAAAVPIPSAQGQGRAAPSTVAGAASVPTPSAQGQGRSSPATVAGVAAVPVPSARGEGRANPATVVAIASIPTPTVFGGILVAIRDWLSGALGRESSSASAGVDAMSSAVTSESGSSVS